MLCDIDTLREFLITSGVPAALALTLDPDAPLSAQNVAPEARAGLARLLTQALGLPPLPPRLTDSSSLADLSAWAGPHLDDATVRSAAVARLAALPCDPPPGRECAIGPMRPEEAPGVSRLFLAIYGPAYPVVDYYVPERVAALNRRREVLTVTGRLDTGEIVGQSAVFRSSPPNPNVYELGQTHVLPAYRPTGLAMRLLRGMDDLADGLEEAEAFFGENVCTHLVTQKMGRMRGYADCALELSLMPDQAYAKEGFARRVSCLQCFRVRRDRPLPLYLPEVYRPVLENILSGFSLQREPVFTGPESAPDGASAEAQAGESVLDARLFASAGVERVQVLRLGRDFPERAAGLAVRARELKLDVVQVSLKTSEPGVARAVDALRAQGFVFGGFAPLWFADGDGLMLQLLAAPPDFDKIKLLSERAKAIREHVRTEWAEWAARTGA